MMWLFTLIASLALGALVGRFLNWLSGAMIRGMEIQWEAEKNAVEILDRPAGLPRLIWNQKPPVSLWLTQWKRTPASVAMSIAGAVLMAAPVFFEATLLQSVFALVGLLMLLMLRIDAEHFILPDVLVFTLLWSGLIWAATFDPDPQRAIIAAFAAYVGLYVLSEGYSALRGLQMMGHGDYKLFSALAVWLPYPMIPLLLLGASITMILLWLVYYRHKKQAEIPFGPALIVAGALLILTESQPWLSVAG